MLAFYGAFAIDLTVIDNEIPMQQKATQKQMYLHHTYTRYKMGNGFRFIMRATPTERLRCLGTLLARKVFETNHHGGKEALEDLSLRKNPPFKNIDQYLLGFSFQSRENLVSAGIKNADATVVLAFRSFPLLEVVKIISFKLLGKSWEIPGFLWLLRHLMDDSIF